MAPAWITIAKAFAASDAGRPSARCARMRWPVRADGEVLRHALHHPEDGGIQGRHGDLDPTCRGPRRRGETAHRRAGEGPRAPFHRVASRVSPRSRGRAGAADEAACDARARKRPCHVPRARRPSRIGTVSDVRRHGGAQVAGMSSGPSAAVRVARVPVRREALEPRQQVRAGARVGVLLDDEAARRVATVGDDRGPS